MPSGTRGAESYSSSLLDSDISYAASINATAASLLPQNRDIEFYITYAGFNLRDAVRKNDPTPLQFQNLPADCRIFYTKETVYNFENLWNYVIDAMWRNPSLCIAGSATPFEASTASNSPAAPPAELSERSLDTPTPVSSIESRDAKPEDYEYEDEEDFNEDETSDLTPRQLSTTTCPICANARETCAKVPSCSASGRQTFTLQCRTKCAGFPADCGLYAYCSSTRRGVAGVCQLNKDVSGARGCAPSRTRNNQAQVTAAARGVGTGPYDYPTSGRRGRGGSATGGIPTRGRGGGPPAGGAGGGGVGGMVNFGFGRTA